MEEILISKPQEAILRSKAKRNLFLAGVGSGKSHDIGIGTAEYIVNDPELIQFIGANTYQQLSKSTLKRVFDVWFQLFGWKQDVDFVVDKQPLKGFTQIHEKLKSYENTILFSNGAMIFTASLDNYKVIDGTEFAVAWLDETKDTKEEAVKEVIIARLRQPALMIGSIDGKIYSSYKSKRRKSHLEAYIESGRWFYTTEPDSGERIIFDQELQQEIRGFNPLYIFTSPAKVDWLNDWFDLNDKAEEITEKIFSKKDFYHYEDRNQCVVISSTYHNETNLPIGYIAGLLEQYKGNQDLIDMLIYGSPIAKAGGEFIKTFRRMDHVRPLEFDADLPVHITLDFNVAPYMTCLVWQLAEVKGRKKLRCIREFCLDGSKNNTAAICQALIQAYGHKMKGLFYYGDPSGKKRQTVSTVYANDYAVLKKKLKKWLNNGSDRVLAKAPAIIKSRDFTNQLFAGVHPVDLEIDPKCKQFIRDLEYAKEDENGKMLKPKVKDPNTGQTYEKYGHCLDAARYFFCSIFAPWYKAS